MFKLRAEAKRIGFAVEAPLELPRYLIGDEGKIRQVAVNLIGNAVKFTDRGLVAVRIAVGEGPGEARLVVEVEDTGPGIAREDLGRLFKPFEQTQAGVHARGGTGLGLALSRELARLMGGEVTVDSRLGAGSCFRFSVPVSVAEAPAERAAPESRGMTRITKLTSGLSPPRVLVVDDAEESRSWLSVLLTRLGFTVREAENGAEALRVAEAFAPRLVLMDLNMPVMDGYQAMRALRARFSPRDLTLVAVTASAFDDARHGIFAAGADAWLRKPTRESELIDVLVRHLCPPGKREVAAPISPTPVSAPAPGLPEALAMPILAAARIADYDRLRALIDVLPALHAAVAAELRALTELFAYDRIDELLRA